MSAAPVDQSHREHDDKTRVVWVLGAGFSRPLGAPLLFDFFRPELKERLKARYEAAVEWPAFDAYLNVLARSYFGQNVPIEQTPPKEPQGTPWRNPEEFIEYVERARSNDLVARSAVEASYRRTKPPKGFGVFDMAVLAQVSKKYLALSCWEFSEGADCATERWAPYRAWAKQLNPATDAVITFNYDTVCEQVVRHLDEQAPSAFAEPWTVPREGESFAEGCDRYLKLHGSSTWYVAPEPAQNALCFPMFGDDETPPSMFLDASKRVPAIAIPGPDKVSLAGRLFKRHWERAEDLLREATVIVFVGYRFPESDNEAKRRLLDAIRQNESKMLSVHIVLGPKRDDDVIRLESLINWSLLRRPRLSIQQVEKWLQGKDRISGGVDLSARQPVDELESWRGKKLACVSHQPLWAQDFLGVFQRENLDLFAPASPP